MVANCAVKPTAGEINHKTRTVSQKRHISKARLVRRLTRKRSRAGNFSLCASKKGFPLLPQAQELEREGFPILIIIIIIKHPIPSPSTRGESHAQKNKKKCTPLRASTISPLLHDLPPSPSGHQHRAHKVEIFIKKRRQSAPIGAPERAASPNLAPKHKSHTVRVSALKRATLCLCEKKLRKPAVKCRYEQGRRRKERKK